MIRSKKRAEVGGTQVAVIIIIIALFMTLYVLFIPPKERGELLGTNQTSTGSFGTSSEGKLELLAESPGLLTPTTETATVHRISSVNIFLKVEPKIISLAQNLLVSNGLFSKSSPKVKFRTESLDETTKVTLFFSVEGESSGELRVKVNGNIIYTEEITASGVKIIEIAKSYLKKDNELELSVSSPTILFWKTNKYNLNDVGIKQEFERKNTEEHRSFFMPSEEKSNLVNAKLKYFQVCNEPLINEVTDLDILLNEEKAYSAKIRCITTEDEIEIDPSLILAGSNVLTFRLEEGDFSFNQISLEAESREMDRPTYFFSLTQSQYNDIQSGERTINLHLLLEQSSQLKNARLLINSNEILMQTDRNTFDRDLKDYVLEGTNFIKVIPINSFNMVGLKVTLE